MNGLRIMEHGTMKTEEPEEPKQPPEQPEQPEQPRQMELDEYLKQAETESGLEWF